MPLCDHERHASSAASHAVLRALPWPGDVPLQQRLFRQAGVVVPSALNRYLAS